MDLPAHSASAGGAGHAPRTRRPTGGGLNREHTPAASRRNGSPPLIVHSKNQSLFVLPGNDALAEQVADALEQFPFPARRRSPEGPSERAREESLRTGGVGRGWGRRAYARACQPNRWS